MTRRRRPRAASRCSAPRGHAEQLSDLVRQAMDEAGAATRRRDRDRGGHGARALHRAAGGPRDGAHARVRVGRARVGRVLARRLGAAERDALVVADARRREVYWARYRDGVRVGGPRGVGARGRRGGRGRARRGPRCDGCTPTPSPAPSRPIPTRCGWRARRCAAAAAGRGPRHGAAVLAAPGRARRMSAPRAA